MGYQCGVCDKTLKIKSKSKHLQNLKHIDEEKCVGMKYTIENPDFSDIDEIFNNYNTNHNQKLVLYLVRKDFEFVFDSELYPHIKSEIQNNSFSFENVFLYWIEYFVER